MANFSSANSGQWYYFDEANPELGGVCLRELSTDEATRIEKLTVKHKRKVVRGNVVDTKVEDTERANRLIWDYCITDWQNVQLDGRDLDCTRENKVKMMKCVDFAKFVGEALVDLVDTNRTLEEARRKNSGTSSGGSSKSRTAKSVPGSTKTPAGSPPVNDAI